MTGCISTSTNAARSVFLVGMMDDCGLVCGKQSQGNPVMVVEATETARGNESESKNRDFCFTLSRRHFLWIILLMLLLSLLFLSCNQ